MNDLQNPHDKFFKELFTRIDLARDFFANYLPEAVVSAVALETLSLQSGSFIDENLQEQFADLLYQVDCVANTATAYLYLLLEHKSYPDPQAPFQMLRYLVRIWERDRQAGLELRPIVPVVVYHGRERWHIATNFNEQFTGPEALRPYWPSFEYLLQDLSRLSDEEVRGTVHLQIGLLLMKYIFDPNLHGHLGDIFMLFHELSEAQSPLEYLRTVLYYVGNASRHLAPEEMVTIVQEALAREGDSVMQTVASYWIEQGIERGREQGLMQGREQGLMQGHEQGLEQGRIKTLRETILSLLEARFGTLPPKAITDISTTADLPTLQELWQTAVDAQTLEEILIQLP